MEAATLTPEMWYMGAYPGHYSTPREILNLQEAVRGQKSLLDVKYSQTTLHYIFPSKERF